MENVRRILESYRVFPIDIEKVTERLYFIKGNKQQYALKRSSLTDSRIPTWINIYRTAYTQNIPNILPIYLNKSGKLFTKDGEDIYYLTPWIEHQNRNASIGKVYQNLGFIHSKTKRIQQITGENRESSRENFLLYKKQMAEYRKKLLDHVEQFEAEHFMSPVELFVCTQYRDLVQVFYVLEKRLNQYLESLEELSEWKVCLCHGRMKDSHVLHGNQLFFINWEHASFNNPILDISTYLKHKTQYYDTEERLLLDQLKLYTEENKLENHELTLLSIHLLDPTDYVRIIDTYRNTKSMNMIDYVVKLQRYHRQLLFGIRFSEYIEEEYEMVSLDESSTES
ncbi:hypothetical protein [Ornithinibacillus sp. 179-J 7C1 HS]|uniref:hypothetical protein n=1 Tax=Ornithinibacillus sp. 179-J 7C1 HS TaxID=3142384 RepID=UPI0039A0A100